MTVIVECKKCGKELRAKDRYAGMPTRCPRCQTINQLPAAPSATPKPAGKAKPQGGKPTQGSPGAVENCSICGKPIRGKAERFTDIHGTIYHLGCYQKRAGDASEHQCRICGRRFTSKKERVKDVVGFYYHRKCYKEEQERQKRQLEAGAQKAAGRDAAAPQAGRPKKGTAPPAKPRPSDSDEELGLVELPEDRLKKKSPAQKPANPPSRPSQAGSAEATPKPEQPKPKRKAESKPGNAPGSAAARPASSPARAKPSSKPSAPEPGSSKPLPARPISPSDGAGQAGSKQSPPKKPPSPAAKKPTPQKPTAKKPPQKPPAKAVGGTPKGAKSKPLPRARPIEERPLPATPVPTGETPDEPADDGLDGLEILDDEPGASQPGGGQGSDLLDSLLAGDTAATPAPAAPAGPALPDGLEVLDDLEPLDDLQPLDGPDPLAAAATGQVSQDLPVGMAPLPGAGGAPVEGILLDPLTGQPATGVSARGSGDSMPKWLWGVLIGVVGFAVLMLVLVVANSMMSGADQRQLASDPGPAASQELDRQPSRQSDGTSSPSGAGSAAVSLVMLVVMILGTLLNVAMTGAIFYAPFWAFRRAIRHVTGQRKSAGEVFVILLKMILVNMLVGICTLPVQLLPVVGQVIVFLISWKYASSVLASELNVDDSAGSAVLLHATLSLVVPLLLFVLAVAVMAVSAANL